MGKRDKTATAGADPGLASAPAPAPASLVNPIPDDPMPAPPQPPQPGDCCNSGCSYCVHDMYQDELDRYHAALKEWHERHRNDASAPPPA